MLHEKGQGTVEYALLFVFIVLVVIILLSVFGPQLGSVYSNIIENL